jgi:hypothetical protein
MVSSKDISSALLVTLQTWVSREGVVVKLRISHGVVIKLYFERRCAVAFKSSYYGGYSSLANCWTA